MCLCKVTRNKVTRLLSVLNPTNSPCWEVRGRWYRWRVGYRGPREPDSYCDGERGAGCSPGAACCNPLWGKGKTKFIVGCTWIACHRSICCPTQSHYTDTSLTNYVWWFLPPTECQASSKHYHFSKSLVSPCLGFNPQHPTFKADALLSNPPSLVTDLRVYYSPCTLWGS